MIRPLVLSLALVGAGAIAASPATPQPSTAKKPAHDAIRFRGSLHDALHEIADRGGIDLVISGNLTQPVDLVLPNVSPSAALQALAKIYHLDLRQNGQIWVVSQAAPETVVAPLPKVDLPGAEGPTDFSRQIAYQVRESLRKAGLSPVPAIAPFPAPPAPPAPPVPPVPTPPPGVSVPGHSHDDDRVVTRHDLTIGPGESVDNAVVYGGNLTVEGHVRGDAVVFGGNVQLAPSAVVEGDVVAFGGAVKQADGAQVHGQKVAFGGKGLGTLVTEGIDHGVIHMDAHHGPHLGFAHAFFSGIPGFFLEFLVCFGLGFLCVMFVPRQMKQIEGDLRRAPLRCFGVGLLASCALGLLTFLLAITLVGIPAAILVCCAVGVASVMGFTAFANDLGLWLPLLRGKKTQASALGLGLLTVLLLGLIPALGIVCLWLAGTLGLGAVVRTRFGTRRHSFPEPI